ncbi:MAG TPA: DUF5655 domain-containing protein, partial [Candidatus Dormibacteraeota bacterium]|nr:DUF5655 domain-containing protein [Candidatus Dormibacteraeota bacterium]
MPTVAQGLQSQIRNIEAEYGRSMDEWVTIIRASHLTKHPDVVAMLKTRFGLKHGAAHRVSLVAREQLGEHPPSLTKPAGQVEDIRDLLLARIESLGNDIERAPKKGYVSLRRHKQFGMIKPGAKWIDLGLILPGVPTDERLVSAVGWNTLFTHRTRITRAADVDAKVVAWLRQAY